MSHKVNVIESRAVGFLWTWQTFENLKQKLERKWNVTDTKSDHFLQADLDPESSKESVTDDGNGVLIFTTKRIRWNGMTHEEIMTVFDDSCPDMDCPTWDDLSEEDKEYYRLQEAADKSKKSIKKKDNPNADGSAYVNLTSAFDCRLSAYDDAHKQGYGLYRIDIVLDKRDADYQEYLNVFEEICNQIDAQFISIDTNEGEAIHIDLMQVSVASALNQQVQACSLFSPKKNYFSQSAENDQASINGCYSLSLQILGENHIQISGEDVQHCSPNWLINYVTDEYAKVLRHIIDLREVEACSRRIAHIRHSMERHMPLIERLQAMQRRLEHDCKAWKRWWLQLRVKVGELFHVTVDSINDLAMELEQNNQRSHKYIDQILHQRHPLFTMLGKSFSQEGQDSAVLYLEHGAKYRKRIKDQKELINERIEGERALLDRMTSLVDMSDQRSTARSLNRLQTWGAMFAVLAICTGLIGQYDELNGVMTSWVISSMATVFYLVFYTVIILYAYWLVYCRFGENRMFISVVLMVSVGMTLLGYLLKNHPLIISVQAIEDIYYMQSLGFLIFVLSAYILLRQKHLSIWIESNKGGCRESILKLEGNMLDAYEKLFQKNKINGEQNNPNRNDSNAVTQLKESWMALADIMDDIDAQQYKSKGAQGSFSSQVDRIRDEVLIARAMSQCILRLPEQPRDLANEDVMLHITFRSNIDFDPIPNSRKIYMLAQNTLLQAYLPPYALRNIVHQYSDSCDVATSIGEDIFHVLLESICVYLDVELASLLAKKNNRTPHIEMQLRERLSKHLTQEYIEVFLLWFYYWKPEWEGDSILDENKWPDIQVWIKKGERHALIEMKKIEVDKSIRDIKRHISNIMTDEFTWRAWKEDVVVPSDYIDEEKVLMFVKNGWFDVRDGYDQSKASRHAHIFHDGDIAGKLNDIKAYYDLGIDSEVIHNDLLEIASHLNEEESNKKQRIVEASRKMGILLDIDKEAPSKTKVCNIQKKKGRSLSEVLGKNNRIHKRKQSKGTSDKANDPSENDGI